ncbi:transglutaminase-like domain-containing protein [Pseudobacteroides cellulosolvens]|nr:transglutaminase-like domain-containing protein [Pseudobacteroides cellulosolvens]
MNEKMENLLRKSDRDFFQHYLDDYNFITTQIGEKLNLVCNSYNEFIDTPIEVIDEKDYKFVIFAADQNLVSSSMSFDPALNTVVEGLPKIDINNIPQRVLNVIEQHKGGEKITLSSDNVIFAGRTENAYAFMIPLNDMSYKTISNYFNCLLKDINVSINPLTPYIMNIFNINSQEAYTKYLQLPENLPNRIKELAEKITSTQNNRYDKVKAIETYLSDNYKYTLTPDDTPSGRDFVDYFLFDLKKGYCTYYATSMVVMLRSLGIPARYVEGYIVTSGSKKGNEYHVTNEKAHAWVEAYFEGFGWIKFEPTAAYASTVNNENKNDDRSEDTKGGKPSWIDGKNSPSNNYELQVKQLPADNKKLITLVIVIVLVSLCILAFAALVLFNHIKGRRKLNKLTKMSPRDSIISSYKLILFYMSLLGYGKEDGETPKDYANRMGKSIVANHANLNTVTDVFILARYSNNAITDKDKAHVLDSFNNLSLYTKQNLGKFKHFTLKYLQGKI